MTLKLIIWNDYFIWYLFINYSMILLMWWRCFNIDAVNELQILQSLVITTCRLFIWIIYFTSSIFLFLTDIDMSLNFFVDRLKLLEEMLSHEWKLCMMTFLSCNVLTSFKMHRIEISWLFWLLFKHRIESKDS